MQEKRDSEMNILDQLNTVYGNLQDLDVMLQMLSNGFYNQNEQKAVQVLESLHYYLENVLEEFSKPLSEYDLMLLHKE